jgi:hypothetical protein
MPDPAPLTTPLWSEISSLLRNLWIVVALVIFFAGNMIVGHIAIPSLVASRHISDSWQKTRPLFYAVAIISFALAIFFLSRVVGFAGVLRIFWDNYWI